MRSTSTPPQLLAPSPPADPVFGHLRAMRRDVVSFYADSMRRYGDVVRFEFTNGTVHLVTHPDHVKRVLQEKANEYVKRTPGFDQMKRLMGEGLVTSVGDLWKRQRRTIQPLFRRERLADFAGIMVDAARALVTRFERLAASGRPFDLAEEVTRATLQIVGDTLLGADVSGDVRAVANAVTFLSGEMSRRMKRFLPLPPDLPTPSNRRFDEELAVLFRIIDRVVKARRESDAKGTDNRTDLLTVLSRAKDEVTGEQMSDRQLRDEVMTMFLAGHETVASALTWTFACLATSTRARTRLHDEVDRVLGGRPPTLADLPNLRWTEQVVKEAIRLYPPISHIPRRATEEDVIGGYRIPKDSIVVVSPFATHRHEKFWPNPEGFDPDRFSESAEAARPRYAYFPFGGGPRVCIGNLFSMIEMQVLVSMLAQRFVIDLVPGLPVEHEMLFTLRPKHALQVTARLRSPVPSSS